ncbi:MAG: hypothetical protein F6K11_27665 [Leptolyngbya sp. SIO3F4]|nr:hypothetical protein [Leptolyngbya sp. SIO3F4]
MPDAVKVYLDISKYWPNDEAGKPVSVNSVYMGLLGTPNEVGRNTLRLALDGRLDRGYFSNQIKLARIASNWAGKEVTILDLMKVEED